MRLNWGLAPPKCDAFSGPSAKLVNVPISYLLRSCHGLPRSARALPLKALASEDWTGSGGVWHGSLDSGDHGCPFFRSTAGIRSFLSQSRDAPARIRCTLHTENSGLWFYVSASRTAQAIEATGPWQLPAWHSLKTCSSSQLIVSFLLS